MDQDIINYDAVKEAKEANLTIAVKCDWHSLKDNDTMHDFAQFIKDNIIHYEEDHWFMDEEVASMFRLTYGDFFQEMKTIEEYENEKKNRS